MQCCRVLWLGLWRWRGEGCCRAPDVTTGTHDICGAAAIARAALGCVHPVPPTARLNAGSGAASLGEVVVVALCPRGRGGRPFSGPWRGEGHLNRRDAHLTPLCGGH